MNVEKLIKETFTTHEHAVPDSEAVLAATRRRIDRRRAVLSRPLAVAAGVVALTLAAVAVVALNRPGTTPADETQAAARQVDKPATKPAIADLTMPYSLDWLPPGSVDYIVRRINTGATAEDPDTPLYGGEYMFTVTGKGQVLFVDVQHFRMMSVDEAAFKSGPGQPVTINGRRGVESSRSDGPGGYELYLADGDGGSMYVNVSADHGSTVPVQRLIDTGRRIAENIRFPGTTTVTPTFGLGDLPSGMRMCAFGVQESLDKAANGSSRSQPSTSYSLGTCTTMPSVYVGTNIGGKPTGVPGKPVQGHKTRYLDEDGYRSLFVLDAVNGAPIGISGAVPQANLYEIANHLVLPR